MTQSGERKPKARLSNMLTQEVSLVDIAANLRRFVMMKAGETMQTNEAEQVAKQLMLPASAKQAMMDGLSQVLEKLSGVAQIVGEAEIDDAASVPAELPELFKDCATMMMGLADQFMAGESEGEEAADEDEVAAAAAEATTEGETAKDLEGEAEAAAETAKDADESADDVDADEVEKAGRKISAKRLSQLKSMRETLDKMIAEVEGSAEKSETKKDEEGDTEEPNPVLEALATMKADIDAKMADLVDTVAGVKKAAATEIADVEQRSKEAVAKADEAIAKLAASARAPVGSNVQTPEGDARTKPVQWPYDMAAHVTKRRSHKQGNA